MIAVSDFDRIIELTDEITHNVLISLYGVRPILYGNYVEYSTVLMLCSYYYQYSKYTTSTFME